MTTDELLKCPNCGEIGEPVYDHSHENGPRMVCPCGLSAPAVATLAEAEEEWTMLCRAVNSFEAMRAALEKALPHMQHLADVERTGCDHLPDSGCDTDCMSECYLSRDIVAVHKALKLANGE